VSEPRSFDGTLVTVPFATGALRDALTQQYRRLLDSHDSEEILVITGTPTSMRTFRTFLDGEVPDASVPRVTSLVVQATDVVNQTDDRTVLSDDMQRELVHRFLEGYEWETDYLQRASANPSFEDDVAQLMETATWQDAPLDETPELADVADAIDDFHAWLADHDYLERGQLISEATAALQEADDPDPIVDAEAVLAVEFEEFLPPDREYLSTLAADRKLVCIAETGGSVRRTWVESGPITDHVSFAERRDEDERPPATRPMATAAYLARGTVAKDRVEGTVRVLSAETAADQLGAAADKIEALRTQEGLSYADFAVAVKQSGTAVTETVSELQRKGIPTSSATVTGFGDDPAVRELLRVVRALADDDPELADDPLLDESILDELKAMDGLAEPLRRWATESNLKARIAADESPLDARTQFSNVKSSFAIAESVESTDCISSTWESFAAVLERAHEFAPKRNQTSSINRDGGVRVDHLQALKNGSFPVVFLLNVVDEEYPGDPSLTRLFPDERVAAMPDYPGVTDVDESGVAATFATDSTASSRPFRKYHAEHARRRLAVGAATARDRLYCCLYEREDTALDERVQPSRFLADAFRRLPWLTEASESGIHSEGTAKEYLLSRADRALADVRRTNTQDVTVSLDALESELAEIDRLLDESGERGEGLREALRLRIDLADGRVRRNADRRIRRD
jgi:hypothetical protein